MGCPQRFYLGEIRNHIAFKPTGTGPRVYSVELKANGSQVAKQTMDVDIPAGWMGGPEISETDDPEEVIDSISWTGPNFDGNNELKVTLKNLPSHSYLMPSFILWAHHGVEESNSVTLQLSIDGNVVDTGTVSSSHDIWSISFGKTVYHTDDQATVELKIIGGTTTDIHAQLAESATYLPSVSLIGGGGISEGGSTTSIKATRTLPYSEEEIDGMSPEEKAANIPQLTVPIKWSGSAGESDLANRPGELIIPAGEVEKAKNFSAADDGDAEWGESAIAQVGKSDKPFYAATDKHEYDITDNDFKIALAGQDLIINNNDSDEDGINDLEDTDGVSNDPDLYELTIKAPTDFVPGASMSISAPSQVKLYTDANKQHLVTTATWILSAFNGSLPTKLFVEAVAGSVTVGDIVISGLLANPETPTAVPATQASLTQPATSQGVGIFFSPTDEQGIRPELPYSIIVGEEVSCYALFLGPQQLAGETSYEWSIGGTAVAGFQASAGNHPSEGKLLPLSSDKLKDQIVHFYWIKGEYSGKNEIVSVSAKNSSMDISNTQKFNVFAPRNASFTTYISKPSHLPDEQRLCALAVFEKKTLDVPAEFEGSINWVQFLSQDTAKAKLVNGQWKEAPFHAGLDGRYPYLVGDLNSDKPGFIDNQTLWTQTDRIFTANIKMMWKPKGAKSIAIPLANATYKLWYSFKWDIPQNKWVLQWGNGDKEIQSIADDVIQGWNHNCSDDGADDITKWTNVNGGLDEPQY